MWDLRIVEPFYVFVLCIWIKTSQLHFGWTVPLKCVVVWRQSCWMSGVLSPDLIHRWFLCSILTFLSEHSGSVRTSSSPAQQGGDKKKWKWALSKTPLTHSSTAPLGLICIALHQWLVWAFFNCSDNGGVKSSSSTRTQKPLSGRHTSEGSPGWFCSRRMKKRKEERAT